MTTYRLYLRSRVRRERLSAAARRVEAKALLAGERGQSSPTIIYEDRKYSYAIRACQEFEAQDDIAALAVASLIYGACSGSCDLYELWDGTRHIDQQKLRRQLGAGAIRPQPQEAVAAESGMPFLSSQSIIAESRRLLMRLSELWDNAAGAARFA